MLLSGLVAMLLAAAVQEESRPPEFLPRRVSEGEPGPGRPQTVAPGFRYNFSYPEHLDRQNISDLAMGAMDLFHLGMQDSGEDGYLARGVKWGASFWFGVAVSYMVHEYGHISSISKAGRHDVEFASVDDSSETRPLSGWGLFMQGLNPSGGGVISIDPDDWREIQGQFEGNPEALHRYSLMIEAGGINQEQALVTRYSGRLREGRLSYLDTSVYLWTSFGTILYPASIEESDITDYSDGLEEIGYEASPGRFKALSALRFVGGSGLASVRGLFLGLSGDGGGFVEPLSFSPADEVRIFWTEFETYLTQAGPTVRTSLPLHAGGWRFLPSYERSFAGGDVAQELGLRMRAPLFPFFQVEAAAFTNDRGGRWWDAAAEIRPVAWAAFFLGCERGRDYTFQRDLYGAGNDFLVAAERSTLIGLRLSASF